MTKEEIHILKEKQQAFFLSGKTLDLSFRLSMLDKLHDAILRYEGRIQEALKKDLGKSTFEGDMCEIRLTLSEISYMRKHLKRYAKDRRVKTNLANYVAKCFIHSSPYGNVLIMSPWNYPILLTLEPLCDALAAGNTVLLKPSAYSPTTTAVLKELIASTFPEEYVAVVTGGREENGALLEEKFDYIFFTGSKTVGKEVMKAASRHLTPVTLELGGKSPVIVTKDADLPLTAKRIVFGKFLNCGQTCVAPDYLLVDRTVKDDLVKELIKETVRQYGENPLENEDYGKIINKKHFLRVAGLIAPEKVVFGGKTKESTLQIAPTILDGVTVDDKVMQEEIFGPILPVLTYDKLEEAVSYIQSKDHPLAFYVFSRDRNIQKKLLSEIGFGGGCVNDTIMHLATSQMGFGGFGESGMGQYHGKSGFDTFSHGKSIVNKATWIDMPMRYQPYKKLYHKLLSIILR